MRVEWKSTSMVTGEPYVARGGTWSMPASPADSLGSEQQGRQCRIQHSDKVGLL